MTAAAWARFSLVVVAAVTFQIAVLNNIVIHDAHPDVMLLVAIGAGLVAGAQDGAVAAFAVGLVADLFVDTPYGASALTYVLVAFAVGTVAATQRDQTSRLMLLGLAVAASAAGTLLYAGVGYILGQPGILRANILWILVVVTLGAAVLSLPAMASVRWALAARHDRGATATTSGHSR